MSTQTMLLDQLPRDIFQLIARYLNQHHLGKLELTGNVVLRQYISVIETHLSFTKFEPIDQILALLLRFPKTVWMEIAVLTPGQGDTSFIYQHFPPSLRTLNLTTSAESPGPARTRAMKTISLGQCVHLQHFALSSIDHIYLQLPDQLKLKSLHWDNLYELSLNLVPATLTHLTIKLKPNANLDQLPPRLLSL